VSVPQKQRYTTKYPIQINSYIKTELRLFTIFIAQKLRRIVFTESQPFFIYQDVGLRRRNVLEMVEAQCENTTACIRAVVGKLLRSMSK
jgi:hypothetical protein